MNKQDWIEILWYLKTGAEQLAELERTVGNDRMEAYNKGYAQAMETIIELIENPTARGNLQRTMKKYAEQGE